jgi:membrane protease YdiL (CAAX protease family)
MSKGMAVFIEPLILYFALFLPGLAPVTETPVLIPFSVRTELARIFFHNLPSLALIWYILLGAGNMEQKETAGDGLPEQAARGLSIPGKRTFPALVIAFSGLTLTGLAVSMGASFFPALPEGPGMEAPQGPAAWIVMALSCLSTGYLEESFFRFYLHRRLEGGETGRKGTVIISTLLFSICHIYEGPWGFLNAVFAGFILSFVFIRFRSLNGIALAHALYNIVVYAAGT